MKTFLVIIPLFIQTFFSFSFGKESRSYIGRVAVITGHVTIKGKKLPLKKGDLFHQGDLLKTGNQSFIKILMKDNTLFKIGPQSSFLFQKFNYEKGEKRESIFNLKEGQIQGIFPYKNLKTKKTSVQFKTPASTLNVTGTEFVANVYKRKGQWKTSVALISGKISIKLPKGSAPTKKKRLTLRAGQVFQFQSKAGRKGKGNLKETQVSKGPKISSLPPKVFKALKNRNPLVNKIFLSPVSGKKGDSSSRFNTPLKKQLKMKKDSFSRSKKGMDPIGGKSSFPRMRKDGDKKRGHKLASLGKKPLQKKRNDSKKKKSFKNKKKLDHLKKKKMRERKRRLRWWRKLPNCSPSLATNIGCKCNDYAKKNKIKCFKKP